jgi:enolase
MTTILAVHGRQVFDSRGRPTVEVEVTLDDGTVARASVPSGASTGTNEAHELRDGDVSRFNGHDVFDQSGCDALLRELDGTPNLARLGANAVLGTSLAVCRASAAVSNQPLYLRIAELAGVERPQLPMPMVNILSGGLHAGRGMDVQDFLAVPVSASNMFDAIRLVGDVRDAATKECAERGLPTLLADEGGLSPACENGREALELLVASVQRAGLTPGVDIAIAIDVAATSLYDEASGTYHLRREGRTASTDQMIEMISSWVEDFPVISVEDALDEEDWEGWRTLTERLGHRVRLVGDDLFTTNLERLSDGIAAGCANGVLVKVNQNGTLTGTLDVMAAARRAGYASVVSARSGETEDDLLADLAVGTAAGQIKVGSVRNSERLAKYNQLLRIAEDTTLEFSPIVMPDGSRLQGLSA